MPARRLPLSRLAGIAAWTAASVTWGTAAVALANHVPSTVGTPPQSDPPNPPSVAMLEDVLPQVPTMPDSGLVVLRYTPAERPEAEVVVRTVVVSGGSGSAPSSSSASASSPKEKSSGS